MFIVSEQWAREQGVEESRGEENGKNFEAVIPGVMHALRFSEDVENGWILHLRLSAHSEAERIAQLKRATAWVRERVSEGDTVIFGGDRNFVLQDEERLSSAAGTRRVSKNMRAAWEDFLASFRGRQVGQPEFTWSRTGEKTTGQAVWTYAILDVAGTNAGESENSWTASCRRADWVPHAATASDHYPVELRWTKLLAGAAGDELS